MSQELQSLRSLTSWLIALQAVSLIALLGGGAYFHVGLREAKRLASGNPPPEAVRNVENWREIIRPHNATHGRSNSRIEIVEFSDFQCPYCKTFNNGTRKQLLEKYGEDIRFTFKHFPLEKVHAQARVAAIAAQCAHRNGLFWEMVGMVFLTDQELSQIHLLEAGRSIGLNDEYSECVKSNLTLTEVLQDIEDGEAIGIRGTPSFLVNGKLVTGSLSLSKFESLID